MLSANSSGSSSSSAPPTRCDLTSSEQAPPSRCDLTSSEQALVRLAASGNDAAVAATAVGSGAVGLEAALEAAILHGHARVVMVLLERGALAAAIGAFASALHRPGLTTERRIQVMLLLLSFYRDGSCHSQSLLEHAIGKVLRAGATMREGPLLLAALVRAGHVFAGEPYCKKALQLNKRAVQISWSVARLPGDGVICDKVRVPVRRHYSGYLLAAQQLMLYAAGAAGVPWSPALHKHYPAPFREVARCLLCCWRREPLSKLPDEVVLCVLEHLAALTYWEPALNLNEGFDIGREHVLVSGARDLSKLPSYKALQ